MQQLKPWQIVLFVAALGAIGFGLYRTLTHNKLDMPDAVIMVDVETGDLFQFSTSGKRGVGVPNINPETKKISLLPVKKGEDDKWYLTQRALPLLKTLDVPLKAVVDQKTGQVDAHGSAKSVKVKSSSR